MYAAHEVEREVARQRIAAFRDGRKEGLFIGALIGAAAATVVAVMISFLIAAAVTPPKQAESVLDNPAAGIVDRAANGDISGNIQRAITAVDFTDFNRRAGLECHHAIQRIDSQMVDIRPALYSHRLIHPVDIEIDQLRFRYIGGGANGVECQRADFGAGISTTAAAATATAAAGSQGKEQNQGKGECAHCCYSSVGGSLSIANFGGVVA